MKGDKARTVLITGGAGFIGSNLAGRLLEVPNTQVRIFDNMSRAGVSRNVEWLTGKSRGNLEVVEGDVRNLEAVERAIERANEIYHFAAQVAVTTSVDNPALDFEVNAGGTFNVLDAARRSKLRPFFLFTSTNKVYGALESLSVVQEATHYRAKAPGFKGVDESERLDFHSPYGCSKGTADQYVRDFARIYGLPTVVFRMSCIAGPRQFGNEDQGWVAHFLYSALAEKKITVFGDGLQVRDVLHVHDLVDAMVKVREQQPNTQGQIYNLGGGPERAFSVLEMLRSIEKATGKSVRLEYRAVRPGDQPLYVSDTAKLERDTGWRARRSISTILADIRDFWCENNDAPEPRLVGAGSAALGEVA
jgi:CDP-paratose 2-epimerase